MQGMHNIARTPRTREADMQPTAAVDPAAAPAPPPTEAATDLITSAAAAVQPTEQAPAAEPAAEPAAVAEPPPTKRRSRWNTAGPAQESSSTSADAPAAAVLASGRTSRWGAKVAEAPAPKRSRWGARESPAAPPHPMQAQLDEITQLIDGDQLPDEERALLLATRTQLVMKMVADQQQQVLVANGLVAAPPPVQYQCKVPLPSDTCPGGAQALVGLVIGARGTTQQLLEERSGCRVVVRGRGSNKTKAVFGEDEDEETHVCITGPSESGVSIAKDLVEKLIDFNSEEGEKMRTEQRRKGQILNGTLREDLPGQELNRLLFAGEKAKETGAFGKAAPSAPPPWLVGPTKAAAAAAAPDQQSDDEYAKLMAEVNEISGAPSGAPAASTAGAPAAPNGSVPWGAGPPPPWATMQQQLPPPQHYAPQPGVAPPAAIHPLPPPPHAAYLHAPPHAGWPPRPAGALPHPAWPPPHPAWPPQPYHYAPPHAGPPAPHGWMPPPWGQPLPAHPQAWQPHGYPPPHGAHAQLPPPPMPMMGGVGPPGAQPPGVGVAPPLQPAGVPGPPAEEPPPPPPPG